MSWPGLCGMQDLSSGGEQTVVGDFLRQGMFEHIHRFLASGTFIEKFQIPSDSYANAVSGCFHAGEGAGRACMNDLVVKSQTLDIVEVI
jgi:hypothetical protein